MYSAVKNLQVNPVNLTTKYRNVFLEYGFGSLRAENCEIERGVSLEPKVKILKNTKHSQNIVLLLHHIFSKSLCSINF